jgi:hypothetical protein
MAGRKHRPRGHIETRPNGTFRAIVYAGVDPLTRKERYLRKSAKTHAQAQIELTKLQSQVDEQRHPCSAITIGQVVEKWLEVTELEDTTRQRYKGLIRLYIGPTFGLMLAAKLDAELLERFYARLRHYNKLCSGRAKDHDCRPLSASTVRQVHFILRAALDRAVRWRYLSNNEAAFATPPSFERPDPDPPSAAEVAALLNDTWQDPAWALFLAMIRPPTSPLARGARRHGGGRCGRIAECVTSPSTTTCCWMRTRRAGCCVPSRRFGLVVVGSVWCRLLVGEPTAAS